ncbi:MAG: aspartate 1-decarboxylase [Deltaproteobacteria bacterium]|nr:aspartate 1-decarboxylase [bacterium]MCB9477536.1 aspartate 1-decarboxylase [Deltaproteobacteria bacterium]MCB9478109.1 aspartate 1-decarboxylase [Deltaproteobacteria bacterium]MCB9487605.1 aspartate 1-decarboxylase [Deltaproteobacteria bacterium]
MKRIMLKSKLHQACVTMADLNYEGSIAIDTDLLEAADIIPYEKVAVWDITNGSRFETYAIPEKAGSKSICVNGAAARLVAPGDRIIIGSWIEIDYAESKSFKPTLVFCDEHNNIKNHDPETTRLASIKSA